MLSAIEKPHMEVIIADKGNGISNYNKTILFKENTDASWIRNASQRYNSQFLKSEAISVIDIETRSNTDNHKRHNLASIRSKSVQNLKELWTSRIEANENAKLNKQNTSNNHLSHAKSYSSLLHIKPFSTGISTTASLQHCLDPKEDPLRYSKDNFNKYKTASNTNKTYKSIAPAANGSISHPIGPSAATMNEKVHWTTSRSNIVALTKRFAHKHSLFSSHTKPKMEEIISAPNMNTPPAIPEVPYTSIHPSETLSTTTPPPLIASDNCNVNNGYHPIDDINDAISLQSLSSCSRSVEVIGSRKKNVNSNRKYSFKTQTKSYHSTHKMQFSANNITNNKVAKLTQQFNEIIQKDKKILDEVKRKNGILISRGGHVYKVIENAEQPKTAPTPMSAAEINRKITVTTKSDKNDSTVQRAIKTFESKTNEKPKIPLKSAQVLRKKKELSRKENTNICHLKPELLEKIHEETKYPSNTVHKPNTAIDENNVTCKLNVHKVVELLENKSQIKTDELGAINTAASITETKQSSASENAVIPATFEVNSDIDHKSKLPNEMLTTENINGKANTTLNLTIEDVPQVPSSPKETRNNMCETQSQKRVYEDIYPFVEIKGESFEYVSELKILSALETVNQRIDNLTKKKSKETFLYPINSINSIENNVNNVIEAVNISLINYKDRSLINGNHTPTLIKDIELSDNFKDEGIYETITIDPNSSAMPVVSDLIVRPQKSFLFSKTKQNAATYETIGDAQPKLLQNYEPTNTSKSQNGSCETNDDGYEICENLNIPVNVLPQKSEHVELQRNTTDKLPELPKPKRIIPKKLFSTVEAIDLPLRKNNSVSNIEEENIYDTIKGVNHCYELLQSSKNKGIDTISLPSNGYESINNYRRHSRLCEAESSSTISSDHKTNSLYEMSLVNGIFSGCNHSLYLSSDNSDDWIDISDSESNAYDRIEKQQQFIVVRERVKNHRSPDWSKRVRDKRQNQVISNNDDVDHYYEPLVLVNKNHSNTFDNISSSTPKALNSTSGQCTSEDYDSFNTDDDIYEDDDLLKKCTSEVDICNTKLPPPPPSKNQVYAFVRKFKNFISNKKSPSDPNKNFADTIQAKMYENTQFQREHNEYQSTLKPTRRAPDKPKTPKLRNKKITERSTEMPDLRTDSIYENANFRKTSSPANTDNSVSHLSTSERSLVAARPKSKSGRSFKSRLKSLGASTSESKSMSTLTTARSTFYISDSGASEQDSGIFVKTSLGNVSPVRPENEQTTNDTEFIRKNKKESNTASSYRRRTTIGIRPNDPPPPPPTLVEDSRKLKTRSSTTSWYAECGVFKIDTNASIDTESLENKMSGLNKSSSGASWYAEAGLYQTSGISVASSSGSSGVSTGNEGGIGDDITHHIFPNEPLYQIYNAEKLISLSQEMEDQESTDGYEEVGVNTISTDAGNTKRKRPSALQLVGPKTGPSRTLWSEIPEVVASQILTTLTPRERSLQEAKFEIITSEASYLKSLNLLRTHFVNNAIFHDPSILSTRDQRALFSYIAPVQECSERLLSELENCWQDNIMLLGLSKSIYTCAEKHFHVYVSYCEHQGKMDRTLRNLKEAKGVFCQKLEILESDPICCGLTLHSFLMLPMQRITRLPLLIDAVFSKVHPNDTEYESWKLTLAILNKIVSQCNEAANRCEQAYEIERISKQLEFPSHIRALAIAPAGVAVTGTKPRFLVKKGELVHLVWRGDDAKLTFGKKFSKSSLYAFLFSDLLVLTKKKSEEQYIVFDYCPRNLLTISSGDSISQLPTKDANQSGKNFILMTLLENHEKKTVELLLSCPSVSEMERWLQATKPPEAQTPGEKLYEQWDCPQVIAKHEYIANEPDLLSLEIGDVVNVSRKLPDGWFHGERIRDGAVGWFPGSFTEEVNSAHVRARNLKQRYRLLTFTATYLEMQKKK